MFMKASKTYLSVYPLPESTDEDISHKVHIFYTYSIHI